MIISYKRTIFLPILITLTVMGMVLLKRSRPVPPNAVFEMLFFTGAAFCIKKINKEMFIYVVITLAYLSYSLVSAFGFMNSHPLDFLQAYKAFLYVPFLAFAAGKKIFVESFVKTTFRILLVGFFIKYLISFLGGYDDRPILYYENNYELIFLLIIFYLACTMSCGVKLYEMAAMFVIFFLSGSRSAMLAFVLVYIFISVKENNKYIVVNFVAVLLLFFGVAYVFVDRLGEATIESIDRYKFLMMFLHDTQGWGIWDYFVGAPPLTPMSDFVCESLSYYKLLFSYKQDGSCYSVILHSFILRMLFDHGILGLVFLFTFVYRGLRVAGFALIDRLCFLSIIAVTSLSVSALNNAFVTLGLLITFASSTNEMKSSNAKNFTNKIKGRVNKGNE